MYGEEDNQMQEMTASYSEISFDSQPSPMDNKLLMDSLNLDDGTIFGEVEKLDSPGNRPDKLDLKKNSDILDDLEDLNPPCYNKAIGYLKNEGTVMRDGDMVLFVAEDLETKIKLSSPVLKKGENSPFSGSRSSTPCLYRQALTLQIPFLDHNVLNELEIEARKVATSVDALTENLAAILHSASALTVGCLETYRDAVCKTCDAVDQNIKSMYQLMAKCEELSKSMGPIYHMADQLKEIRRMLDLFESAVNV